MKQKPWLNEDGSFKNDVELQKVSRSWLPSVWEEYLSLFDVERQESIVLPPEEIDKFSSEQAIQLSCEEEYIDISTEKKLLVANHQLAFINIFGELS